MNETPHEEAPEPRGEGPGPDEPTTPDAAGGPGGATGTGPVGAAPDAAGSGGPVDASGSASEGGTGGTGTGGESGDTSGAGFADGSADGWGGSDGAGDPDPGVRTGSWTADGPAELEVTLDVGQVRIELGAADEVTVEVRHEPSTENPWQQGLSGVLSWLGDVTGGITGTGGDPGAAAVQAATIEWSEAARRLVVRSTQELPLRVVPLTVTVRAPADSRLAVRTGAGDVRVEGRAGWSAVRTGSGNALLDEVAGTLEAKAGSGRIEVAAARGRSTLRTGSGTVEVGSAAGPADVKTGSGEIRLGEVTADLTVRTGSGDVTIADAVAGRFDLTTGSGDIRLGVHSGVVAQLDLRSASGRARSELDVDDIAPAQPAALVVRGKTGSGDIRVNRAAATV